MRDVDPFDFWEGHASSIDGLGGAKRSPDPRYIFHTRYHAIRPGPARYVLRLSGVLATFGELSVRLHAWKPGTNSDASYVSGTRFVFGSDEETEVTLPLRFAAQEGVLYALYGYLSEDSDLAAQALHVAIEEVEETGDRLPEPPRSVLASGREPNAAHATAALQHYGRLGTGFPVSQSCTADQIAELNRLPADYLGGRGRGCNAAIARWSELLCLNALTTYGATEPDLDKLIVGGVSAEVVGRLAHAAAIVRIETGPPPARTSGDFFDLLLMPAGSAALDEADPRDRWQTLDDWLVRLKRGGLAVIGLRYQPDADAAHGTADDAPALSRNEIGQWALRLIARGHAVAPLAFAPVGDLVRDDCGLAGFLLIIQRG